MVHLVAPGFNLGILGSFIFMNPVGMTHMIQRNLKTIKILRGIKIEFSNSGFETKNWKKN